MRKFIKILSQFILVGFIPLLLFFILFSYKVDLNPAKFDFFYRRFTSEKQVSLIIGTSRAAQGIQPQIINNYFTKNEFALPIYNYSFTVNTSPFGKAYLNSIKKKINIKNPKSAIFIVSVDPWALSDIKKMGDSITRREDNECIAQMNNVNLKPNFEYIFRYFSKDWLTESTGGILNEDGWLQIDTEFDSVRFKENTKEKIKSYSGYKPVVSNYRIHYFLQTVEYLKNFGSVYIVRMPVSKEMFNIEDRFWQNFDKDILNTLNNKSIDYFSFRNQYHRFTTIDGNHLYKESGSVFTKELCDSIKSRLIYFKNNTIKKSEYTQHENN